MVLTIAIQKKRRRETQEKKKLQAKIMARCQHYRYDTDAMMRRRLELNLTVKELAERAETSAFTIEQAEQTGRLKLVVGRRLIRALAMNAEETLLSIEESYQRAESGKWEHWMFNKRIRQPSWRGSKKLMKKVLGEKEVGDLISVVRDELQKQSEKRSISAARDQETAAS